MNDFSLYGLSHGQLYIEHLCGWNTYHHDYINGFFPLYGSSHDQFKIIMCANIHLNDDHLLHGSPSLCGDIEVIYVLVSVT